MILRLLHRDPVSEVAIHLARVVGRAYLPFGLEVRRRQAPPLPPEEKNAVLLLRALGRSYGAHISLLVVDNPLIFPEAGEVFGCTAGRLGIISTHGLKPKVLAVEALHEVGHLLGLDHCPEDCLMGFSANPFQAQEKPCRLCHACRERLQAILEPKP